MEYDVLEQPIPPHIDSLPGRDLSRTPVARRDSSLHYIELKRPKIEVRDIEGNFDEKRLEEVSYFYQI